MVKFVFIEGLETTCGKVEWRYSCLVNGAQFVMMELLVVVVVMPELFAVNWDITHTVMYYSEFYKWKNHFFSK